MLTLFNLRAFTKALGTSFFFALFHFARKDIWTLWIASIVCCVATSFIIHNNTRNVFIHRIYSLNVLLPRTHAHTHSPAQTHPCGYANMNVIRISKTFWRAWMDGIMLNIHAHNHFRFHSISVAHNVSASARCEDVHTRTAQPLTRLRLALVHTEEEEEEGEK